MITLMMYLDGNTILESDHWIGGVKTTVVEKDADQVINQAILLKDLAEKKQTKKEISFLQSILSNFYFRISALYLLKSDLQTFPKFKIQELIIGS